MVLTRGPLLLDRTASLVGIFWRLFRGRAVVVLGTTLNRKDIHLVFNMTFISPLHLVVPGMTLNCRRTFGRLGPPAGKPATIGGRAASPHRHRPINWYRPTSRTVHGGWRLLREALG